MHRHKIRFPASRSATASGRRGTGTVHQVRPGPLQLDPEARHQPLDGDFLFSRSISSSGMRAMDLLLWAFSGI